MVNNLPKDTSQTIPSSWGFDLGQNIDREFQQTQENEFARTVVQGADTNFQRADHGMGSWQAPSPEIRDAMARQAEERFFQSEAARSQFHQQFRTPAQAQILRPARTTASRDGFTLRKDAGDLDFEDVVDAEDYPSAHSAFGLRRMVKPPSRLSLPPRQGRGQGGQGGGQTGNGRGGSR